MKRIAYAFAACLVFGGPALAAEGKAKPCHTLEEAKARSPGSKVSLLNAGQFHLLEGVYIVLPPPSGLPAADAAVLVQNNGKDGGIIVWTRGSRPTCLADATPMPISDKMIAILRSINSGKGEKIDAIDPDDDLRL